MEIAYQLTCALLYLLLLLFSRTWTDALDKTLEKNDKALKTDIQTSNEERELPMQNENAFMATGSRSETKHRLVDMNSFRARF